MTPGELLRELRDIHLPEPPDSTTTVDFAFEPLVVLLVAVLALIAMAIRRRRRWRSQARALLRDADREPELRARWSRLVALAAAISRRTRAARPPDCVYLPIERIGPEEVTAVRSYVRTTMRQ